ncbi:MAG: MFS transporter [Chloroflexi bacterium]|nr:MFS transporter [Chloroflexota bacterium]
MMQVVDAVRSGAARMLSSLEHPQYRTLWFANMWAGAAAWALIVTRGVQVLQMSDNSSFWVGMTTFAAMFPIVVVPPLAGYLADRLDRKTVLAWTFVINLVANVALTAAVVSGEATLWQIILLSLVNGVARAAQVPASQALLPSLVPQKDLMNALALNQATVQGSRLIGPLLVAPLLATLGTGAALGLCSVFYLIGLLQMLRVQTPAAAAAPVAAHGGTLSELGAGFAYVYRHPVLRPVTLLVLVHCGLTMSFESMLPEMSHDVLHIGSAGVSYMMMAVGGGALIGTMVVGAVQGATGRGQLLWYCGLVSGLSCMMMGVTENAAMVLAASVAMGASQAAFMTMTGAIMQTIAPNALRGRIASIYILHGGGVMAFANLGNGALADGMHALQDGFHGPPIIFATSG